MTTNTFIILFLLLIILLFVCLITEKQKNKKMLNEVKRLKVKSIETQKLFLFIVKEQEHELDNLQSKPSQYFYELLFSVQILALKISEKDFTDYGLPLRVIQNFKKSKIKE
ncbi:hypothetical protein [Lactococcus taiwanensis]|uniref:hypothetical protein n=1 Tax=Lactococcus taiwanensis TaxID=1151742 RepID=UPI003519CF1F